MFWGCAVSDFRLQVKGDMREVLKDLRYIDANLRDKASVTALNRTIKAVRSQAVKKVAARHKVTQKVITRRTRIQNAKRMLKTATVIALRSGISFGEIANLRQLKAGAAAGSRRFPGMFIAAMPRTHSGKRHRGVFFRVPGAEKLTTSKGRYAGTGIRRQPIKEKLLWTNETMERAAIEAIDVMGRKRFQKEFDTYMRFLLMKKAR